jgi:hypothetical protein
VPDAKVCKASVALIPSFAFAVCVATGGSVAHGQGLGASGAGSLCTNVAPLDDRYPIIVVVGQLSQMASDLPRLQALREREGSSCVRFALGVHAPPEVLLKPLRDIALSNPQLLLGVAVVPLSGQPAAPVLLWHSGYEQEFQSVDAAAVAARAYVP